MPLLTRRGLNLGLLTSSVLGMRPVQAESIAARAGIIPVLGASPVYVAEKEGWFNEGGLKVNLLKFESGPDVMQAAASGTIDVHVAGIAPVAVGRAHGIDLRVVAATAIAENVLVAGSKFAAGLPQNVPPAEMFKQYRQKTGQPVRIATQPAGSVPSTNLNYWLSEVAHVDPADVRIVSIGIDGATQALLSNSVEASTIREPILTVAKQRDPGIKILALGDDLLPGQPGTVVAVSAAFAQKNPEAVRTLVKGVIRGVELLQKEPDRAAADIQTSLGKGMLDIALIRQALVSPATHFVADPHVILKATQVMLAFQKKIGTLDEVPELTSLFDTSFYDAVIAGK
ncbi:ABC transporter substrate-binding protein [Beijerinckia indica]|uniref:ABC-type nitrate/sulfonate/bicarbonate transport systems periplasmic components-like protein n=1 Tax=Beijerinckia indica subsp. indica (strain ATCC 9039 / DSM 1715 / NCIMB 8712) TaxID=395963 RepID=B2IDG7_BEII9|nr:ABC transporter substrate-binding protein [Beijerinckia indica]ACB94019.1 ABC-type nitrate/sulfonate/bicarbonate transport systems periplasmic components-like protein [Beijerinckia indica subsp. indica ATCC 9039]